MKTPLKSGSTVFRPVLLTQALEVHSAQDTHRVASTDAIQKVVEDLQKSQKPLQRVQRLWQFRSKADFQVPKTTPGAVELSQASATELRDAVSKLAAQLTLHRGEPEALSAMVDLHAALESGRDVAAALNDLNRRTPNYRRLPGVSESLAETLDAARSRAGELAAAMSDSGVAEARSGWSLSSWFSQFKLDPIRHSTGFLAKMFYSAIGWVAMKFAGKPKEASEASDAPAEPGEPGAAEAAVESPEESKAKTKIGERRGLAKQALDGLAGAVPAPIRSTMARLSADLRSVVTVVTEATDKEDRPDELADDFAEAVRRLAPTMDPNSDAVAVGVLHELVAGVASTYGSEVIYDRRTKELTVKHLSGLGVRAAVGGTLRGFSRSIYGDAEAIKAKTHRSGLEVGLVAGHASAFWNGSKARGFATTISAGFNTFPIISDQSAFTLSERPAFTVQLSDEQGQKIEAALADSPEIAKAWTGRAGKLLSYAPSSSESSQAKG